MATITKGPVSNLIPYFGEGQGDKLSCDIERSCKHEQLVKVL